MAMTKKQKAARARKAAKTRAANLTAGKRKSPARRRRSGGRMLSDLSSNSFSVIGMSFLEAGVGAIVMSAANSMVKSQSQAVRMAVNIAVPVVISKVSKKPMAAAGAAGIAVVNIARTLAPDSKFLNDFEVDSFMNDLDGNSDFEYINPAMVQGSQFYQLQ
jgi:hypothetical protein